MSRRQHHGHGHGPRGPRHDAGRGQLPARRPFDAPVEADTRTIQAVPAETPIAPSAPFRPPVSPMASQPVEWRPVSTDAVAPPPAIARPMNGNGSGPVNGAHGPQNGEAMASGATAPQFRRFIKSRAYVPMHELRRRFGINGMEDDVTPVEIDGGRVYVGLPAREGLLLGELFRGGEVGYELSLDPCTPIVIGVYPMRPVPRH